MYKGKFKIWIVLVILSIVICNFKIITNTIVKNMKNLFSKQTFTLYTDIDNIILAEKFNSYDIKKVEFKPVTNIADSQVIIKQASSEEIEGFTKYSNQFYTPIIMFAPGKIRNENDFIKNNPDSSSISSYPFYQKDLKTILEAIENNKTYTDIGISKEIFKGDKIILAIPEKNNVYYESVKTLIALTLNNYSYDNLNSEALQRRVNSIIVKCKTYEEPSTYIKKVMDDKKNRPIVLAPECIVIESGEINGSSGESYYMPCIPQKTINIYYDLYLKNTDEEDMYKNLFISLKNKKFADEIGLRNKEMNFKIRKRSSFHYTVSNIPEI